MVAEIEAWECEPAVERFALVREQIERLAIRLGKAKVDVVWEATDLRLPPRKWAPFWSAFAHVIRNTVDHGVETTEARVAAGKPSRATIRLRIERERDQVVVSHQRRRARDRLGGDRGQTARARAPVLVPTRSRERVARRRAFVSFRVEHDVRARPRSQRRARIGARARRSARAGRGERSRHVIALPSAGVDARDRSTCRNRARICARRHAAGLADERQPGRWHRRWPREPIRFPGLASGSPPPAAKKLRTRPSCALRGCFNRENNGLPSTRS